MEELSTVAIHLPDTVVSLLHGAFSWCQILRVVVAPGCKHFGAKVFEECRSLNHLCFTLRDALLQVARNFEQYASKEKAKHGEGHLPDPMPLTNVSNSISPNGSDFCRPMPMIYGEKTFYLDVRLGL